MAYTHYDELENTLGGTAGEPKLAIPTFFEDNQPASFYPEDILLLVNNRDCASVAKRMATFWGQRHAVWVGYDSNGSVLKEPVVLQCPPYYPPHSSPLEKETRDTKPPVFP